MKKLILLMGLSLLLPLACFAGLGEKPADSDVDVAAIVNGVIKDGEDFLKSPRSFDITRMNDKQRRDHYIKNAQLLRNNALNALIDAFVEAAGSDENLRDRAPRLAEDALDNYAASLNGVVAKAVFFALNDKPEESVDELMPLSIEREAHTQIMDGNRRLSIRHNFGEPSDLRLGTERHSSTTGRGRGLFRQDLGIKRLPPGPGKPATGTRTQY